MSDTQQNPGESPAPVERYRLAVSGMSCGHCVAAVEKAVSALPGVESVEVSLEAPVRAAAPGQAAVFYDGDRVLGGGWIARG